MRVLLLEDDAALSKSLVKGLREDGFAVDAASRTAEADDLLRLAPCDLIVLDLGLPDEDGLAFLRRLRARGNATPVLILTAPVDGSPRGLRDGARHHDAELDHAGLPS